MSEPWGLLVLAVWLLLIAYTVFSPLGLRTVLRRTSAGVQVRVGVFWIDVDPDEVDFVAVWTSREWFLRTTSVPVIVMKREAGALGKRVQHEAGRELVFVSSLTTIFGKSRDERGVVNAQRVAELIGVEYSKVPLGMNDFSGTDFERAPWDNNREVWPDYPENTEPQRDPKLSDWIAPDNWPEPPTGYVPPNGWVPKPSWPPAPKGHTFWRPTPVGRQRNRKALLIVALGVGGVVLYFVVTTFFPHLARFPYLP
jgi:hypothetical protein